VAYNEPYTYTKLGKKLDSLPSHSIQAERSVVCRTPLGNCIEMLTVSKKNTLKHKKVIFITSRTHPVETAGSFVMEGIIDELTKSDLAPHVVRLLDHYVVKLVPMINPDGVIVGNSRCNFHGFDLNRHWKNPVKAKVP
jgi:murein tripeptide amidase MpaA